MEKTIFQKIVDREIPASIVYEDEKFLAFLDIAPVKKGHTLLITKEPYVWMQDVPDSVLGEAFVLTKKLMSKMISVLPCDYVQIGVVGKDVPHFHIHLIPRNLEDDPGSIRPSESYEDGEKEEIVDKLK